MTLYRSLDALPPAAAALWDSPATGTLTSRCWLQAFIDEARAPAERPRLFVVDDGDAANPRPLGLMTGFTSRVYNSYDRARVLRFHQADGGTFAPVVAPGVAAEDVVATVLAHACRATPPNDAVRIGPLPRHSAVYERVRQTLRDTGFLVQPYCVFDNRYEFTAGVSSEQYLKSRSSRLRNTIVRRNRAFDRAGNTRFELVTDAARVPAVFEDYVRVFDTSWKLGEHMVSTEYVQRIMECAARAGALRLGLLYLDERAIAAQFWVLSGTTAMCYRLAFSQRFSYLSPGTVLTWRVVRHLLDEDHVGEFDFGIGDDAYKKDWMSGLREHWGVDAYNRRTARGLRCAVRHFLPPLVKPLLRPLWHRLRPWLEGG